MGMIRLRTLAIKGRNDPLAVAVHARRLRAYGDPGLLGKLLGGVNKIVRGVVSTVVPGGKFIVGAADALTKVAFPGTQGVGGGFYKLPSSTGTALAIKGLAPSGTITVQPGGQGMIDATRAAAGLGRRRYRRMNPLNYRALVRSTRRIHRASKIMRTVFSQAKRVHAPRRQPRGVRGYRRKKVA